MQHAAAVYRQVAGVSAAIIHSCSTAVNRVLQAWSQRRGRRMTINLKLALEALHGRVRGQLRVYSYRIRYHAICMEQVRHGRMQELHAACSVHI